MWNCIQRGLTHTHIFSKQEDLYEITTYCQIKIFSFNFKEVLILQYKLKISNSNLCICNFFLRK